MDISGARQTWLSLADAIDDIHNWNASLFRIHPCWRMRRQSKNETIASPFQFMGLRMRAR